MAAMDMLCTKILSDNKQTFSYFWMMILLQYEKHIVQSPLLHIFLKNR